MNPPSFPGSSVIEDPNFFNKELQKAFEIMHVVDPERVELDAYQMKGVARIWFEQRKKNQAEGAPLQDSLIILEYNLMFTQLSLYAPEMVADMRSRISLFVAGCSRMSSRESRAAMLIGDMDIARMKIHVQ
ncbi:hypothetical protein H5410_040746 [Solanum commersonii]|uniref:Gag-pol polyprotein n=1 Tax=Solanum commersonii TaxID=4109 RepID=A0A9J5XSU9_SOLCO|nr:hypothetical protein H5410_040746 [Solanum commersonii]